MMKREIEMAAAASRLCRSVDVPFDAELIEVLNGEPMKVAFLNPPASREVLQRAVICHMAQYLARDARH